jgi:hypothetical protein
MYRMVAVSPLGSDLTVMRLSVVPLDKDTLARLSRYTVLYSTLCHGENYIFRIIP